MLSQDYCTTLHIVSSFPCRNLISADWINFGILQDQVIIWRFNQQAIPRQSKGSNSSNSNNENVSEHEGSENCNRIIEHSLIHDREKYIITISYFG